MKLIKIRLENIRSYLNEEIDFQEGSTLLWGNIGSGKSSILLAIDFALFGLQRGNLTGASLLRNGAEKGSVELLFTIEEEEYVIKRTLKRARGSVTQDSGYIISNGIKEEKTAVELKQAVLEILNYPRELLTKNKALIYRYTVYTPQEEMKSILLGSKEDRLDTLRKVFGVDKYKRVKENSKSVVSKLKEMKKLYEGAVSDLNEKLIEKEKKEREKVELEVKLQEIKPKAETLEIEVLKKKAEIKDLEVKKEELTKVKKEIDLCRLDLKHKIEQKNIEKIILLQKEVEELENEKLDLPEGIIENIKKVEQDIVEKEKYVREVINTISEFRARKRHSLQIKQKIESLNNCPTCLQEVSLNHKQGIIGKCDSETKGFDEYIKNHEQRQLTIDEELKKLREKLQRLKKDESEINVIKLRAQQLKRKKEELTELVTKAQSIKLEIGIINSKIIELQRKHESLTDIEQRYPQLKAELDLVVERFHAMNIEKNTIESTLKPILSNLQMLNEEINKKIELRAKKEQINKTLFWLTDYFMPLMDTMEQNILLKVHSEFNSLFEKWFSILIDNQTLSMALDDEYSPKIWQNGYDIDYEFLSGGEKTAGALAYRLALNQVINNLNTGLKTKDLLILDEPTDGFSHEQLDRLRILMDEIQIPQIIIVSHEPQIESFVDNIIKVEKIDHQTNMV